MGVGPQQRQQQPAAAASRAPRIAFALFLQLDNEAADEALCKQVGGVAVSDTTTQPRKHTHRCTNLKT